MRILITGGAGYLGSVMVPSLLTMGARVTVVDNFMYRQQSLLDCCASPMFDIIRCDCRDIDRYKKEIVRSDFIIPLAAITGAPACDQDRSAAKTVIVDALSDLIKCLSRNQYVLYPNTNSGYGSGTGTTFCNEESPLNPVSYYGQLKCQAENIVREHLTSIIFRLATVFGASPRMRLDLLVNDFVYRAVTDKFVVLFQSRFKRNYISIRDVVRAFEYAIHSLPKTTAEVYNLGLDSANLTKMELCAKIKEHIPEFVFLESEIGEDPDKRNYIVSSEKLKRAGFSPQTTLDEGIEELIKAYAIVRQTEFSNV